MSPFRRDAHRCPEGRVVYFLFRGHKVVYVGQSSSVFGRIGQHRRDGKEFDSWAYIEVDDEEAYRVEFRFIGRLKPEYNNRGV